MLPQWSDLAGWNQASSYQTIQTAHLDGPQSLDLIGRSAVGLWVEQYDPASGQWALQATEDGGVALPLTDEAGWNQPQSYQTIQTGDITGNGHAYLLASIHRLTT